jgi:hypothetical protein
MYSDSSIQESISSTQSLHFWSTSLDESSGPQAKPSQAKVLTEGKELCEAQVDIPLPV